MQRVGDVTTETSPSGAPGARLLSPAQFADGEGDQPLLDNSGSVVEPLLLIDLDAPANRDVLDQAVGAACSSDRIIVGVAAGARRGGPDAELAAALDVTLVPSDLAGSVPYFVASQNPEADARRYSSAAAWAPQAALMLAWLLRNSEQQAVLAAVDAESLAYSTLLGGMEFRGWLDRRGPRPALSPALRPPVLIDRAGNRLRITLNRPERRNAYGREMRDALVDALKFAAADDTVHHVVLDGAGSCFCSGGDLAEFGTAPDLTTAHFVRTRAGAGRILHQIAGRLEARLHGSCVGAGIELPAFAGRVVARPDARFRLPEVGMGLIPGAGGTVSIPRRIGRWRTLALALSGQALNAETARAWGLVDELDDSPWN